MTNTLPKMVLTTPLSKKGLTFLLAPILALNLIGCGGSDSPNDESNGAGSQIGYLTFLEGNPGIEQDQIFVTSTQIEFTTYSLTAEPKPLVGPIAEGVTITVISRLPRASAYQQIYYEFGFRGTQCLVRIQDNNVVRPRLTNSEATFYSQNVLSSITDAVRRDISTPGARITNRNGCSNVNRSDIFFNRLEFLNFGRSAVEIDAVIIDSGLVTR